MTQNQTFDKAQTYGTSATVNNHTWVYLYTKPTYMMICAIVVETQTMVLRAWEVYCVKYIYNLVCHCLKRILNFVFC